SLLFSARLPPEVLALAAKYLRPNAVFVHVGDWQGASPLVKQRLELVSGDEVRKHLLIQRLQQLQGMAVVFTNSMAAAAEVHTLLTQQPGLSVSLLHSGLEQQQREEALQCFRYGVTRVLVATGLAGRGLDMPDVTLVINYDMPISLPDYVYR
ncbi:DEAD/DEAH box helicase, partial [Haematococcus lacustris]